MNTNNNTDTVWLFGYGSLMFKVDFPYVESRPASIRHWVRRFWQGSHDHRGTQEAPGRVVTLAPQEGAVCAGVAYRVGSGVFGHLDFREKNGYLRLETDLAFDDGGQASGLVYIALEKNPAFLGPASEEEIARHIFRSSGPSGHNVDYLLGLADALRRMAVHDPHVFEVEAHVKRLRSVQL